MHTTESTIAGVAAPGAAVAAKEAGTGRKASRKKPAVPCKFSKKPS
jgi:hypothetical protein